MSEKKVIIYNPSRYSREVWLPMLWCQAKTYYQKNGKKINEWKWVNSFPDIWGTDYDKVKQYILDNEPKVFAISLYVWNYQIAHDIAKWVKEQWPNCFVVSGGPHQYFKHDANWFKNHPWLDASLPGECYGEIFFQEILDNITDDGKIDFDEVTDVCYPWGKSRTPVYSKKKSGRDWKRQYDYAWPSFAWQKDVIQEYAAEVFRNNPKAQLMAGLETTRGCPYGCTYCDWGGGINTQVVKKDVEYVYEDIDFLCSLDATFIYFMDANFGIFGDRDVSIMQRLISSRRRLGAFFVVGFGGFAKTANKLPYQKEILRLAISENISAMGEFKASIQSLDDEILKNIDRKNVELDLQLQMFSELSKTTKKLPVYVELILGLPGMTLEKFYRELDILAGKNLSVFFYEWFLLPEAPAFASDYRKKFGLKTTTKTNGWYFPVSSNGYMEVVTESASYTNIEYLQMILSISMYHAMVRGGLLSRSVKYVLQKHNIGLGQLIKKIIEDLDYLNIVRPLWDEIMSNPARTCTWKHNDTVISLEYWFPVTCQIDKNFLNTFKNYLKERFNCPVSLLVIDEWTRRKDTAPNVILQEFLLFKNSGKVMHKSIHRSMTNFLQKIIK